ncbi:MAG: J domain-containing protein, partial [Actinomycetes bacterium]
MARRELWEQVDSDLYQVLGVDHGATEEQIGDAWRAVAKRTHPDRGGSVAEFQAAEVAYQVLSDPFQRRRYDRAMLPSPQVGDVERSGPATTRSSGFDWAAATSWHNEQADVGFVPQFE